MIHPLHLHIHRDSLSLQLLVDPISPSTPGYPKGKHLHYSSATVLGDSERSKLLSLDPELKLEAAIAFAASAIEGKD